jgi:hypothetical protein
VGRPATLTTTDTLHPIPVANCVVVSVNALTPATCKFSSRFFIEQLFSLTQNCHYCVYEIPNPADIIILSIVLVTQDHVRLVEVWGLFSHVTAVTSPSSCAASTLTLHSKQESRAIKSVASYWAAASIAAVQSATQGCAHPVRKSKSNCAIAESTPVLLVAVRARPR